MSIFSLIENLMFLQSTLQVPLVNLDVIWISQKKDYFYFLPPLFL